MKKIILFILSIVLLSGLFSCSSNQDVSSKRTIQKRKYRKGVHVNFLKRKSLETYTAKDFSKAKSYTNNYIEEVPLSASNSNQLEIIDIPSKKHLKPAECDVIVLKNGVEMLVKVLEIGESEIKYKKCGFEDGPTYLISNQKVDIIKYPNGLSERIESDSKSTNEDQIEKNNNTNESIGVAPKKNNILSLLSFIFTLCSLLLGILLVPAFVLGIIGWSQHNKYPDKYKNKWMAKFGTITSGIILVIAILALIILILALGAL